MGTNVQIDNSELSFDEILGRRLIYLINEKTFSGFSLYFSKYGEDDWTNELYYKDPKEVAKVYEEAEVIRTKFLGKLRAWLYVSILAKNVHRIAHIEFREGVCCVFYKKDKYLFVIQRFMSDIEKELKCKTELIYERSGATVVVSDPSSF